jgi:lysophospholipase L1-like esterase
VKRVLVISLLLNLALVVTILVGASFTPKIVRTNVLDPIYERGVSQFETLPVRAGDVVFLGDTLVAGGLWCELFPDRSVRNRGIVGDTSAGVLARLHQVSEGDPGAVVLMVGTFDVLGGRPRRETVANVETIVTRLGEESPGARVLLLSVLPRDEEAVMSVDRLNADYAAVAERLGVDFLDLSPDFATDEGLLDPALSNDGLHLNGPGYQLFRARVGAWLEGLDAAAAAEPAPSGADVR